MNQRNQQSVEERLRQNEIQEEIWRNIQEARENVKVTISKAASLFGLTESRLREWDKRGLLQTERSVLTQQGKGPTGHRQYSTSELEKLAIISVLLNHNVSLGEIPSNVDQLWREIIDSSGAVSSHKVIALPVNEQAGQRKLPIDQRVDEIDRQEFWRYFVAQTLRLTLLLICEDVPDSLAGIILPLEDHSPVEEVHSPQDFSRLGLSLVGWQGRTRSFSAFLDSEPSFEYASDYRLERLVVPGKDAEHWLQRRIILVFQRKARQLSLSAELVQTVCRMLELVYARLESWRSAFDVGTRDWLYAAHDLERASQVAGDLIFNSLLERIIELGGKSSDGQKDRWSFCALLVPHDLKLPIQKQILVVRAQTEGSPYEIGMTSINQDRIDSLSQKAFLSGQMLSFPEVQPGQTMVSYLLPSAQTRGAAGKIIVSGEALKEERTRSALVVPLSGEYGISIAVLYIASEGPQAFTLEDQRVLRFMGRMLEELLQTSQVRRNVVGKLENMLTHPELIDPTFQGFASEADFLVEVETFLRNLQQESQYANAESRESKEALENEQGFLSIISLDVDNQSSIALKYGNRVARNLSQLVGNRILPQKRLSDRFDASKVFHVAADKYYWLLPGVPLNEARDIAFKLKDQLETKYKISPSYIVPGLPTERPVLPENMLELTEITVHLGISSYTHLKLVELLRRYPDAELAPQHVLKLIVACIEEMLELGKSKGGDCIVSWTPEKHGYGVLGLN